MLATIITDVNVTNTNNSITALLVPGLQWTLTFFVWTGLIILEEGLPTLLLTLRWSESDGEGNGGKLLSLNENYSAIL